LTRPAFYLFAGLFGIASLGMLTINLDFKSPAENLLSDVTTLLKNIELDLLLVVAFVSGKTIDVVSAEKANTYRFSFIRNLQRAWILLLVFVPRRDWRHKFFNGTI